MAETEFRFNLRVYGIIHNDGKILITDEFQLGRKMTKFPGGGLKYGEGATDCLKREIKEECNGQELIKIRHFYTTDFFQKALFCENHQLISIYYLAELKGEPVFTISEKPFDFKKMKNGNQSFRWIEINSLNPDEFSFPVDKFVIRKIKEEGI
ncbi:MAG: NUDIX domain-containing protein [Prolixibacteraceae bacterium]|nr:NUDIX domain-containing protein [Prolixibacteraceae bacterium]MBN2773437.1 NUDIX domain-containing protein [Prolixibacteraceae bacterium]